MTTTTTNIQRIRPSGRMSQAVVHGGRVELAGQVAEGKDVAAQTRAVLAQIDALLAEAGTDKSQLLSATIWLADATAFPELNELWEAWLAPGCAPVRAVVEARPVLPQYRVEIAVAAAVIGVDRSALR